MASVDPQVDMKEHDELVIDISNDATSDFNALKSPTVHHADGSDDSPGVTLRWSDVKYQVEIGTKKEPHVKHILKGIDGEATPGYLLVIKGPSGAGKSSLVRNDHPNMC